MSNSIAKNNLLAYSDIVHHSQLDTVFFSNVECNNNIWKMVVDISTGFLVENINFFVTLSYHQY